jgi:putative ubiquitin-RnfH superfamily antitoxin RatB of RatAB toxin-antitoxin module
VTEKQISIEVAFALPTKQLLLQLAVEKGATVEQTIIASGILKRFP